MLVYHFEGVPRNPLTVALKNVLTLGLHTKVWLYRVNREMDGREGFHIHLGWLAVMVWLPFVTPAIVKFQTAARLNQMVSDPVTIPLIRARRLGWISLIPVFGAGFYAYWVQSSLNKFWFWNRRKERYQLNVERIKQIAKEPESEEGLQKRFVLEEECRRIEREMEEEVQAVRMKWGEQKFSERKKRADLHAKRGRLTRKQVHELRMKEKERRKQDRLRRRRERSLIARYKPRRADPEKDELWEPYTPLPQRMPEEIQAAAKKEGREPTRKESMELKRAERLLAAREKESLRLEKRRAKLLARLRRKEAKLEALAAKKEGSAKAKGKGKGKQKKKAHEGAPADARLKRRLWVLPPQRDPEVDEHWEPPTPAPERDPEEILAVAGAEGREPSKKEHKEAKRAEKLLDKRDNQEERLEAAREKARTKAAKQAQKQNQKGEKKDLGEKKRSKKKEMKGKGKGKDEPGTKEKQSKKRLVLPKKGATGKKKPAAKKAAAASGEGALKVLQVRCPQCKTQVPVKKRDDRPARLQCPSCGLVGKV